MEQDWHEREYNPRVRVTDVLDITARWEAQAAAFREQRPPRAERYGEHPREVIDVWRAERPRGVVHFIHGGYWRALSKDEFSWIAAGFLGQGLSVSLLNYPLCPEVTLERIRASTEAAFAHLHRNVLDDRERETVVVSGHSAGGYLSALHLLVDWTAHGLPAAPIRRVVPISGVFRLAPLLHTSMNEALRLDAASAQALSLDRAQPAFEAEVALVVGGDESDEFRRQSEEMARNWVALSPPVVLVPGTHHFDVVDGLGLPGSPLNRLVAEGR